MPVNLSRGRAENRNLRILLKSIFQQWLQARSISTRDGSPNTEAFQIESRDLEIRRERNQAAVEYELNTVPLVAQLHMEAQLQEDQNQELSSSMNQVPE
jgi:hypothetical protein